MKIKKTTQEKNNNSLAKKNDNFPVKNNKESIGLETNVELIGFFSSIHGKKRPTDKKTITRYIKTQDKTIKQEISICPMLGVGRPITIDLDIYRAFLKYLENIQQKYGQIKNPVTFKNEDVIKLMGKQRYGRLHKELKDWLVRMRSTTILGVIYVKVKGKYGHTGTTGVGVFDQVVIYEEELPNGNKADKNYVWLSRWFLSNLNSRYIILIDYEIHKKLRKPIAKCLYSLLWQGFYASYQNGNNFFCKNYTDLCTFLGITKHKQRSLIIQQLSPSFKDLINQKVISKWEIEKNIDNTDFNIKAWAGKAFKDYYQSITVDSPQLTETFNPENEIKQPEKVKEKISESNRSANDSNLTMKIVKYFHAQFGIKRDLWEKEIDQANQLLTTYGKDKTKYILNFAISQMHKTNFKVLYFGAIKGYITNAIKNYEIELASKKREQQDKEQQHNARVIEYKKWLSKTPEERIEPFIEMFITRLRTFEHREPTPEELDAKIKKELAILNTPEQEQIRLFGKVIFTTKK